MLGIWYPVHKRIPMSQVTKDVGKRIRELRTGKSLTQEVLADRTGLTPKFISEVECGKTNPSLRTLEKIAGVLKVGIPDLLSHAPKPKIQTSRKDKLVEEVIRLVRGKSPQKVKLLLKGLKAALK
jgi:transcriptional regulator with XRE-family HTH domain